MRLKWFGEVCAAGLLGLLASSSGHAKLAAKPAASDEPAVLVGAGDIADCTDLSGAEATAKLLEQTPGTVMAVGDLAYPDGSKKNFACYDKTWGRVKARTRPAPGNHEFHAAGAMPYFDYFGAAAGPKNGYYSYELGTWHIVVLNSECKDIGGCERGLARGSVAARRFGCSSSSLHAGVLAQAAVQLRQRAWK